MVVRTNIGNGRNYPQEYYAQPCLISYYMHLKIAGRASELARYLGYKQSSTLTSIIMLRQPLPLEIAIKIVAFSQGELYLGDMCPYIKEYLPIIAKQQNEWEEKQKKKKEKAKEKKEKEESERRNYKPSLSSGEQIDR